MILIPVKNVQTAKQRLSAVLDAVERAALAEAMLEDVLRALATWQNRPPVALVTSDTHACRLAQRFSFQVIDDPANRGETEAIATAKRVCEARGVSETLVVPGDIPLLEVNELETILAAAPDKGTVLVPAADGRGTNAVWQRPPNRFPLRFGMDSFAPHLKAAQAAGEPCIVLRLPSVALDVDTPADLASLLAAKTRTRSQELLHSWSVLERLERLKRPQLSSLGRFRRASHRAREDDGRTPRYPRARNWGNPAR